MGRSAVGRVGVLATVVGVGLVSPLVASAAVPTLPTPGNLSISVNGQLKHQEGTARSSTDGVDTFAVAAGDGAVADVLTGAARAGAVGDYSVAQVTGAQSYGLAFGSGTKVFVYGADNGAENVGDTSFLSIHGKAMSPTSTASPTRSPSLVTATWPSWTIATSSVTQSTATIEVSAGATPARTSAARVCSGSHP